MIAALFDFDGTLYTGHVWQDLAGHHWQEKQNRRWVAAYVVRNMMPLPLYQLGLVDQVTYYRLWGETMSWLLRGWQEEEGRALFTRLTEERIMPNLRQELVSRLRSHQEQGHWVALVSGTFAPWLEIIAHHLGVEHAIGTPLELQHGRFSGRIIPPLCQGEGKPARVRAYLSERGLQMDWLESYAYADSGTDIDLLTEIGHPVAVYPDEVLWEQAQAMSWPVIGEREP
jgi:putative phosphoserine phosphatase/1-acylglycerol-3-phosphate O-acyltransferase